MSGVLRKRDYEQAILDHCKTMCHMKCELEDFQTFRRLIGYNLQKIGEIEHEKALAVWNTKETNIAKKVGKKSV